MSLSTEKMEILAKRMEELKKQGVHATEEKSGELNMSGCASGYCMAWD